MKILLVNDVFPRDAQMKSTTEPAGGGGGPTIVASLAEEYARMGHDIHIVTTHQGEPTDIVRYATPAYRITSLPIPCSGRWYRSLRNPNALKLLERFLNEESPFDAVHVHFIHQFLSYGAMPLLKHHTGHLLFTFHDVMSVGYGRLRTKHYLDHGDPLLTPLDNLREAGRTYMPFRNIIIRHFLRSADTRIAVSDALKQVLMRNGVTVDAEIHNGIDVTSCAPSRERMEGLKRTWSLGDRPCIFLGGRIRPDKGITETFKALRILRKSFPDALLLIVGDRKRAEVLLREFDEARAIERNVVCVGWLPREDVLAALALSTVCVTPSVCFDSFPTVNLEAIAVGVPVIGTCFGGTREIVENGVSGFIIDPRKTDAYANALKTLIQNPVQARSMGEAGRKRVMEHFTLKQQADAYLRLFFS